MRDLVDRLIALSIESPSLFPTVWCFIGTSGEAILEIILRHLAIAPELIDQIGIVRLHYDRDQKSISCSPGDLDSIAGKDVFLVDSAIHSGASMLAATKMLRGQKAARIMSYSLVVKRGANFIPNYFGLLISDYDRALFLLDKYPNNRLSTKRPFGTLRALDESDADLAPLNIKTTVESIGKITWGDLIYDKVAHGKKIYIYESDDGHACAFISYKFKSNNALFLDTVVVSEDQIKKDIGATLIRWVETSARAANCNAIELWSIEDKIPLYKRFGYTSIERVLRLSGTEKYTLMRKQIVYNVDHAILD